jgi:hypothetical protein
MSNEQQPDEFAVETEDVDTQDVEPERETDPPESTPDEVHDPERDAGLEWVTTNQQATVTLPSGASFLFGAGQRFQLTSEDAAFVVDHGYGTRADNQNEG